MPELEVDQPARPLDQAGQQPQFHVAGALELLEEHVVHPRPGVYQGGAQQGQ